jgi:hypothetical protein
MKSTLRQPLFWLVIFLLTVALWPTGVRHLIGGESRGNTSYYSSAELTNSAIPLWNPTNTIPLSPDKAVIAAIDYANSKRPQPLSWDVDTVELRKLSPESSWFYIVTLTDRKSERYELEVIRILMNGKVWVPKGAKK